MFSSSYCSTKSGPTDGIFEVLIICPVQCAENIKHKPITLQVHYQSIFNKLMHSACTTGI